MPLPPLIEFLLGLRAPNDPTVRLLGHGFNVFTAPYVPPGTTSQVVVSPLPGDFADIGYRLFWDPNIILPNVFQGDVFQWGERVYTGVLTAGAMAEGFDTFLVVTEQQPIRFTVTNRDPVRAHFYYHAFFFLSVRNMETLRQVYAAITRYGGLGNLQDLAVENIERVLSSQPQPLPVVSVPSSPVTVRPPTGATWPPKR
jgi:hypothetical protein